MMHFMRAMASKRPAFGGPTRQCFLMLLLLMLAGIHWPECLQRRYFPDTGFRPGLQAQHATARERTPTRRRSEAPLHAYSLGCMRADIARLPHYFKPYFGTFITPRTSAPSCSKHGMRRSLKGQYRRGCPGWKRARSVARHASNFI